MSSDENVFLSMPPRLPNRGLLSPTLDDEVRRLVFSFGITAVRDAVKRRAKKKIGRPSEKDWPNLRKYIQEDATDWLEGKDPFLLRSNYSISNEYSEIFPGHNRQSTHRRIMQKLSSRRELLMLMEAENISEKQYSYILHIRVLKRLSEFSQFPSYRTYLDQALVLISEYTAKFGQLSDSLTMEQVKEGAFARIAPPREGFSHYPLAIQALLNSNTPAGTSTAK
jgi:hypothetical protein